MLTQKLFKIVKEHTVLRKFDYAALSFEFFKTLV